MQKPILNIRFFKYQKNIDKFELPNALNSVLSDLAELNELDEMKYLDVLIKKRFDLKEKELDPYRKVLKSFRKILKTANINDSIDHFGKIKKKDNKYWTVKRDSSGRVSEAPISNFIINIISQHSTSDGIIRYIQYIRADGRIDGPFELEPKDMSRNDAFIQYCYSKGKYVWGGSQQELSALWCSEFGMIDDRIVYESDHMGWLEKEKFWLFQNIAIADNGQMISPDKNNIIWLENNRGIKLKPLVLYSKEIAAAVLDTESIDQVVSMEEIREKLIESINKNNAVIVLGWIGAIPFMREVIEHWECFPFLSINGEFQSGKSTVMSWVSSFFSMNPKSYNISETTAVAIQRYLSYYSCLPIFLDENTANDKKVNQKDSLFRSVYRQDSAGKGVRSEFGTREGQIRGTLAIAGESTSSDAALNSRFVHIFISKMDRKEDHLWWFMKHKKHFSNHFLNMLKRKSISLKEFISNVSTLKEDLCSKAKIKDDRASLHYAIILSGYHFLYGEHKDLTEFVVKEVNEILIDNEAQKIVNRFLDETLSMWVRGVLKCKLWDSKQGVIYLYLEGMFDAWAKEIRQQGQEMRHDKKTLMRHLKSDIGYVKTGQMKKINGKTCSCMTFNLYLCSERIKKLDEADQFTTI